MLHSVTTATLGRDDRDSHSQASTASVRRMASQRQATLAYAGFLHASLLGTDASLLVFRPLEGRMGTDAGNRTAHRNVQQGQRMDSRSLR